MANNEEQDTLGHSAATKPEIAQRAELSSADMKKKELQRLEEELRQLKEELQRRELSQVTEAAADLGDEQLKTIQDRLYKMIDYTVRRQDWYTDQCHRLLQIGLALIATGGAIAALFGKLENLSRITQILAWAVVLSLFFTGIVLVYVYNNYLGAKHPYRKVVDIHSWYFAYQFPEHLVPKLSKSAGKVKKQVAQEADYINKFFNKFLTNSKDPLRMIREDIEQVAILLILQRYRAQQTTKMSEWLLKGLGVTLLLAVSLMTTYFFISPPRQLIPGTPTGSSTIPGSPSTPAPVSPTPSIPAPTNPATSSSSTPTNPAPTKTVPVKPAHKRPHPGTQPPP